MIGLLITSVNVWLTLFNIISCEQSLAQMLAFLKATLEFLPHGGRPGKAGAEHTLICFLGELELELQRARTLINGKN